MCSKKYILLLLLILCSCKETEKNRISRLVNEWTGKEIIYFDNIVFTLYGQDTLNYSMPHSLYTIVSYVDSIGCIGCKLQLPRWREFIHELDSTFQDDVFVSIFLHPKNLEELSSILMKDKFDYPICIDLEDTFNKLNHFPSEMEFQTFLLDKNNKVVAIGNPIHNPQVKELYLNIIQGKSFTPEGKEDLKTEISIINKSKSFGKFDWQQEQKVVFTLTNTGINPLVVDDVATSCGCTSVDYSKEPVRPGDSVSLHVTYKADHPEHFDKTITVYCNAKPSPVVLRITGDAE